jgi:hypothetical protein
MSADARGRGPRPAAPGTHDLHEIVELASRAPSIHNTQPWRWRGAGAVLELHADADRWLAVADPLGRMAVISCGAALHHACVAARALGWEPTVERIPQGPESSLLARVHLKAGSRSTASDEDLSALRERHTDRRRFTSWPVPSERLEALAHAARHEGTLAFVLDDPTQRFRADMIVRHAHAVQDDDPLFRAEQEAWLDVGRPEGLVAEVLPENPPEASRFPAGAVPDRDRDTSASDQMIVLATTGDLPAAWLRTGEGLSALWLTATRAGLSVVPLSQVIEVAETRADLRHDVLESLAVPQLLLRIGWQAISRSTLPHTPRRSVDEVFQP